MVDRYDHELILGYVEGELSPEDQARCEAVLGEDPALRQFVCDLQADRLAVRQMADEDPPADLVEGVIQRLERQMLLSEPAGAMPTEFRRPEARRLRFHRALGYCAIAAVLLISGALVFLPLTRPSLLDDVRRHDTSPPNSPARRPNRPETSHKPLRPHWPPMRLRSGNRRIPSRNPTRAWRWPLGNRADRRYPPTSRPRRTCPRQ